MKRILTLSLVGAIMLGLLGVGVASAHGGGQGGEAHGYHYGIWVACTQATPVSGLAIYATATAAVPGSTLGATVAAKHSDPSTTFTAPTASATIPGVVGTVAPTSTYVKHAVASFGFPVSSTATVGQKATVSISGSASSPSGSTTFTCTLNVPVVSATQQKGHHGDEDKNGDEQGENEQD